MANKGDVNEVKHQVDDEDDIDDSWDDWGDAEDQFEDAEFHKPTKKSNDETAKQEEKKAEDVNIAKNSSSSKEKVEEQEQQESTTMETSKSSWGGMWKVLSTATEGLGNITTSVSQSLNQVIGVPDPEEMARINATKENNTSTEDETPTTSATVDSENSAAGTYLGLNLVSGVTNLGSKMLNTGLDTLEGIGKKTMNMLQENDPHLKNKRKLLGLETDQPNLSDVLKAAKADAEQLEESLNSLKIEKFKKTLRFELLFENNCGLVHLEALEILSKESCLKLQKLQDAVSGNALLELQETVKEVKELMELEDLEAESDGDYSAEELQQNLVSAVEDADLQINFNDIVHNWSQTLEWLANTAANVSEQESFAQGITALAEACALEINKLHKIAELLLVKEHHSTALEVEAIVQLCKQFNLHLNGLTNRYAAALSAKQSDEAKTHISTLFGELLEAMKLLEKAFKLFLPIIQIGAV